MSDALFWTRLAFTSCGLLRESADARLRGLWIDDFMPESASDTRRGVAVEGTAWIGDGPRAMHQYHFIVSVPQRMLHRCRDTFSITSFDLDAEQHTLQMEICDETPVA